MNKHRSNDSLLSPVEKLANVYDSLADDVFVTPAEVDEEKRQRAYRVASAAISDALGPEAEHHEVTYPKKRLLELLAAKWKRRKAKEESAAKKCSVPLQATGEQSRQRRRTRKK
jgi:hypothetical protein